ncbi:hypothetical protein F4861DRAFT_378447 [Xylaria intraflava]|nr:hypothetical protein F4861DRAFT_378447 [Xylaria intraflava]
MADPRFRKRAKWQDRTVHMSPGKFEEELKRLDTEIGALVVERVHMRTSTNELAAREVDNERWSKQAYADDWSYIDLLVSRVKEPSQATVTLKNSGDEEKQARWRTAVMKAYNAEVGKLEAWCPISQTYEPVEYVAAAHIVRYNVGEQAAVHLFGPSESPKGHIWSLRNGIPLLSIYEKMLEDGQIAIIPTDGDQLMVVVLDDTERAIAPGGQGGKPRGRELHGRILKFLSDHRPEKRYLYFCFAMNILRRQKFEVNGWWRDRIEYAHTPFFATPGTWIRKSTLRKLAARIGYLPTGEAEDFAVAAMGERHDALGNEEATGSFEEDEVFTSRVEYSYLT